MKIAVRILFLACMIFGTFFLWLHDHLSIPSLMDATPIQEKPETENHIKVHIQRSDGKIEELPLEEYLYGVVGSEMHASFEMEALKAQAVAARTFVAQRNYQVDDTTASQVYYDETKRKEIWQDDFAYYEARIHEAVDATKSEVMLYEGQPITAAFFSSCNGYTNNAEDYWANPLPYLKSVESPWDKKVKDVRDEKSFALQDLSTILGFQNTIRQIQKPIRYENGYVKEVNIDGIVFTGRELREQLQLRSSAFTITITDEQVTFVTEGYGHGIGMSQIGAQGMALEGYTYQEILQHYYQNIEISSL